MCWNFSVQKTALVDEVKTGLQNTYYTVKIRELQNFQNLLGYKMM